MKKPEITRSYGIITRVGNAMVKEPNLPDWSLNYIQYPPGEKEVYRDVILRERDVRIVKVTKQRIYFEPR